MKVKIPTHHVIAIEEDGDRLCIVTAAKTYCAQRDKVRYMFESVGGLAGIFYELEI